MPKKPFRTFQLGRYVTIRLPLRRIVLPLPLKAPEVVRSDDVTGCAAMALVQSVEAQRTAEAAYEALKRIERDIREAKQLVGDSFTHARHVRYYWPDQFPRESDQTERGVG